MRAHRSTKRGCPSCRASRQRPVEIGRRLRHGRVTRHDRRPDLGPLPQFPPKPKYGTGTAAAALRGRQGMMV